MAEPDKTAANGHGRDPITGRFLEGNCANPKGRPRGIDLRRLVRERCEKDGVTPEDGVYLVYLKMVERAQAGDVSAAKLVFDRLCDTEALKVEINDYVSMPEAERAARIKHLLALAEERRKASEDASTGDTGNV